MCWVLASRGRLEKFPSNHRNEVAASLGMLRAPWSGDLLKKTLADVAPIPGLLVHVHKHYVSMHLPSRQRWGT